MPKPVRIPAEIIRSMNLKLTWLYTRQRSSPFSKAVLIGAKVFRLSGDAACGVGDGRDAGFQQLASQASLRVADDCASRRIRSPLVQIQLLKSGGICESRMSSSVDDQNRVGRRRGIKISAIEHRIYAFPMETKRKCNGILLSYLLRSKEEILCEKY